MRYEFELRGTQALLLHNDNLDGQAVVQGWQRDPDNKNLSVAGDDRSPAWTWHTYFYMHDGVCVMPSANVAVALRKGGSLLKLKGMVTYKELTQSGLLIESEFCELSFLDAKRKSARVTADWLEGIHDLPFEEQRGAAQALGFDIDVRRAKVGQSKHVRTRPRFKEWAVRGTVAVLAEAEFTPDVLDTVFRLAGQRGGLGDWRPSAPKSPGPYGVFASALKPVG